MSGFFPQAGSAQASLPASTTTVYIKRTLYYGSHSFATQFDDDPASTPIEGRLLPFTYKSEISTDDNGRYAGSAPIDGGQIELINQDGTLDQTAALTISDGFPVRVKVGLRESDEFGRKTVWPYKDFGLILHATAEQWLVKDRNPVLKLRDASMKLLRPAQPNLFGGGGGQFGSVEIGGLTQPICYGECLNISPALIDPDLWIYQFNDQASSEVSSVRDRGVRLINAGDVDTYAELEEANVTYGYYLTCLAQSCIRLGGSPIGQVTADVKGAAAGKTKSFFSDNTGWNDGTGFANEVVTRYVDTTASIISRLLTDRGVVRPDDIESSSFFKLDQDQPAVVGIYLPMGDTSSMLDVINRLVIGVGAYFGQEPWGRYEVRRFEAPQPSSSRLLTDRQILSMRTVDLPYRSPPMQWQCAWARNWTLQTAQDLVDAAMPADRQIATRPRAIGIATNNQIRAALPSPRVATVESFFTTFADANNEAQRLSELYTLDRGLYQVMLPLIGVSYSRGENILIRYPHPKFTNGRAGIIVGQQISVGQRQCLLTVFS